MAALQNPKHEAFAQACAEGKSQAEAYRLAGFKGDRREASKARHRPDIARRVGELQERAVKVVEKAEEKALERTIEKEAASRERVLAQWARIAFFDLRKAVTWNGGTVSLTGSDELDDDTALAISEVKQGKEGVSIKAVDRVAALTALSKHFGIFQDEQKPQGDTINNITNNLLVLEAMTPVERLRRIATMLRDAGRTIETKPEVVVDHVVVPG
jgi:phage terminase small subunit